MTCDCCEPLTLSPHRLSEGHVAVRFKDTLAYRVFLNGADVSNDCTEAMAGREGWVILWGGRAACHGCNHACQVLRHGEVRVESTEMRR